MVPPRPAQNSMDLMRPGLHEFLAAAYEHYDIIIWSATSMRWVELKMKELEVTSLDKPWRVVQLIDHSAMITVATEAYGVVDIKPLGFIWCAGVFLSGGGTPLISGRLPACIAT